MRSCRLISVCWRLMRFHQPVGLFLLLWPTLIALWIAGQGHPSFKNILIFVLGVVLMRAAGCIINDIADRHWDGLVTRTQARPLPQGQIKLGTAFGLLFLLVAIAFGLVLQTNTLTVFLSAFAVGFAGLYPFLKRWTHWPQLGLGIAFAWAIPMAFSAEQGILPWRLVIPLFFGTIFLTLAYDTLYAVVDRVDDLKVGIKSTAILLGRAVRVWVGLFQGVALVLFSLTGLEAGLGWPYQIMILLAGGFLIRQQIQLSSGQAEDYFTAFRAHQWVGFLLWAGVILKGID